MACKGCGSSVATCGGTTINPLGQDSILSGDALMSQNVNLNQRSIVFPLGKSLVTNVRRVFVPRQTPQSFYINRFFTGR